MTVQNSKFTPEAIHVFRSAAESVQKPSKDPSGRVFVAFSSTGTAVLGNVNQKAKFEEVTKFVNQIMQDKSVSTKDKSEIMRSYEVLNNNFQGYTKKVYDESNVFKKMIYGGSTLKLQQDANNVVTSGKRTLATEAATFKSIPGKAEEIFKNKPILRAHNETSKFEKIEGIGGAGSVANKLYQENLKNPKDNFKIGVMIAANSGQPAGKVGIDVRKGHAASTKELNYTVQEETVMGNILMTECGNDPKKQEKLLDSTITGKWGMVNAKGTMTIQGHDFSKKETTSSAHKYNQAYVVKNLHISDLEKNPQGGDQKVVLGKNKCPVVAIFTDSVNANRDLGKPGGTMQRTFNPNAENNQAEFRECVKVKLRAGLDGAAEAGVTCPMVALLSGGIYAGKHADFIKQEYNKILKEVLEEPVGPNKEPRGQYFHQVVIPTLSPI